MMKVSSVMPHELKTDILIVGGGVGGCAAAMAATSLGCRVILTEQTDWLGGQLTTQAVPPDEHPWIERFGCTARYRQFRQSVRNYFKCHYPLEACARSDYLLNPGMGTVSGLCHEPRIALAVIDQMLAFPRAAGHLRVLFNQHPISVDSNRDYIRSVKFQNRETGSAIWISADYILDATELGDLLSLAKIEYVCGAESQSETAELNAVPGSAQRDNVQAFTWCFPIAFDPSPEAAYYIDKPDQYDRWRSYVPQLQPPWSGPILSWDAIHPITLKDRRFDLFGNNSQHDFSSLWHYRRIIATSHFDSTQRPHEVTLVNWPQNDYFEGSLIDKPGDEVEQHLTDSRQLSLSLLYWLQTEAPHPNGGYGYPGLYLCPELVGTSDGLAKFPYVRESRRIKAIFTVTENHIGFESRQGSASEIFDDSVGVGYYRIDLHPTTGGNNYIDVASMPFQIPLGALLPVRVENIIPACKNIGTTHISNGCYRLHPVEWNIGEAAGLLASFCHRKKIKPRGVRMSKTHLTDFRALLTDQGVELNWPASAIEEAIQFNIQSESRLKHYECMPVNKDLNDN